MDVNELRLIHWRLSGRDRDHPLSVCFLVVCLHVSI